MSDPLSVAASVVAVAGFAAESSKTIFRFFHGMSSASQDVRHSILALQSLHATLTNIQEIGAKLPANYSFPSNLRSRLHECIGELKTFEAKIKKIDSDLQEKKNLRNDWEGKAKRSLKRLKWLLIADQQTAKFLVRMNSYHNEFSLDLLALLFAMNISQETSTERALSTQTPPRTPDTVAAVSFREVAIPSQTNGALDVIHYPRSFGRHEKYPSYIGQLSKDVNTTGAHGFDSLYSPISVRASFVHHWTILYCQAALWVGPVTVSHTNQDSKIGCSTNRRRKPGFGLVLSLNLSRYCNRRLQLALNLITASASSRTRLCLFWEFGLANIIPREAEILRCVEEGAIQKIQDLFSSGTATPQDTTIHGTTLLHIAVQVHNLELVRLLLREGGDVNARNEDGDTPLHFAMAKSRNYEIARVLIENGADLGNTTVEGQTPLHTFFNDTVESVILFHGHLIDTTDQDSQRRSITHFVAWSSKSTPEIFERAMKHDTAGTWAEDDLGRTCLHLAASRGNMNLTKFLLQQANKSHEVSRKDNDGRTALHYAIRSKRVEIIDLLLKNGANLYELDDSFRSALHSAARWGNVEAAQKLIRLDDTGVLHSVDKYNSLPSDLSRGSEADLLREFLVSVEAPPNKPVVATKSMSTNDAETESEKLRLSVDKLSNKRAEISLRYIEYFSLSVGRRRSLSTYLLDNMFFMTIISGLIALLLLQYCVDREAVR